MNHIGNNSISSFFLFFFPNNQVFCLKFVLLVCVCYCYSFSTNQENIYFLRSIHNINVKVEKRMAQRNTINKCKSMQTTIFSMSCHVENEAKTVTDYLVQRNIFVICCGCLQFNFWRGLKYPLNWAHLTTYYPQLNQFF